MGTFIKDVCTDQALMCGSSAASC